METLFSSLKRSQVHGSPFRVISRQVQRIRVQGYSGTPAEPRGPEPLNPEPLNPEPLNGYASAGSGSPAGASGSTSGNSGSASATSFTGESGGFNSNSWGNIGK